MSFGSGLILALLILSPGFSAFAGFYIGGLHRPFRPAPAAPGSILALGTITFGALAAHALGAWLFVGQEAACAAWGNCIAVSFEPNPYASMLAISLGEGEPSGPAVAALLSALLAMSAVGYLLGRSAVWAAAKNPEFRSLLYGWADNLIHTDYHVVSAFVVSDVQKDGFFLGYEGTVADLKQSADGEVKSIALADCERFLLIIDANGLTRQPVRRSVISFMVIEAENIRNIALNPYFFTDEAIESDSLAGVADAILEAEATLQKE